MLAKFITLSVFIFSITAFSFITKRTPASAEAVKLLDVQVLNFSSVQNEKTDLTWTIIANKEVDHFEIERSLDNDTYAKVNTVSDAVKLNEPQSFSYADDLTGITNDVIYYRLKIIGKAGEIKYSNVLVVRQIEIKPVTIIPDPANDNVSVRFVAEKESEITLWLVDNAGRMVLLQTQKTAMGANVVQLQGLSKYDAGVYTMQVMVNNDITSQKLILFK